MPSPILHIFSYLEDTSGHCPYMNFDVGISEVQFVLVHEGACLEGAAAEELLLSSP